MKSGSNQLHAMADPLCLLHYPMVTKRYWWSIVMLVRPTIIAAMYNARDRGSGLIQVPPQPRTTRAQRSPPLTAKPALTADLTKTEA
jgi:hypothetical protein